MSFHAPLIARASTSTPTHRSKHAARRAAPAGSVVPEAEAELPQLARGTGLQAKLRVGPVHDPLEQEADRIALRVVSGARATMMGRRGDSEQIQRNCSACEDEESVVRRKAGRDVAAPADLDDQVSRARTGGRALPPPLRAEMEAGFGRNFSQVRVHEGTGAHAAARAIGARAFTVQQNIFFDRGEFRPQTRSGRLLIAHELTHVLQQRGTPAAVVQRVPLESVDEGKALSDRLRAEVLVRDDPFAVLEFIGQDASDAELDEMALHFVDEVTDDEVSQMLRHRQGHLTMAWMIDRAHALGHTTTGPIQRFYGVLSAEAVAKIEAQNYESGKDQHGNWFPNTCMDAVLGNMQSAVAPGFRREVESLASKNREAAGVKDILNSQNLNAATELGGARYLGIAQADRSLCIKALAHQKPEGGKFERPGNPFDVARAELLPQVFKPDPVQMMLKAVAGADRGWYLFQASVLKHHSVSFLLKKLDAGPVTRDSGKYRLFWNDQFTDGAKVFVDKVVNGTTERVAIDDGSGKGRLGMELGPDEFVAKVIRSSMEEFMDPTEASFWAKSTHKDRYEKKAKELSAEGNAIRRLARNQRCTHLSQVELWHVIPR